VRREDADDGGAARGDPPAAGHRHLEGEAAGAADDLLPLPRREHPLGREQRREPFEVLVRRLAAEVVPDDERAPLLVARGARPDPDRLGGAQSFSSGA
jgi:hypothetical protein